MTDSRTGSSIKYVLITEAVAQRKTRPVCLGRGLQHKFHALIAAEEEDFDARSRREKGDASSGGAPEGGKTADGHSSFEEYREKSKAAGVM